MLVVLGIKLASKSVNNLVIKSVGAGVRQAWI